MDSILSLSIYLSISIYLSFYLSLSIYLSIYLSLSISISLSFFLSFFPSLSIFLSFLLYLSLSFFLSLYFSFSTLSPSLLHSSGFTRWYAGYDGAAWRNSSIFCSPSFSVSLAWMRRPLSHNHIGITFVFTYIYLYYSLCARIFFLATTPHQRWMMKTLKQVVCVFDHLRIYIYMALRRERGTWGWSSTS